LASNHACIVNGQRKIFQSDEFVQALTVIAVPVTGTNLQYYYKTNLVEENEVKISEEDVERIANKTAEKVVKILADAIEKADSDAATTDLDSRVEQIFTARCAKCHSETNARGSFSDGVVVHLLEGAKLVKLTKEQKGDIFEAVDTQKMPQDGTPLSVAEIQVIRDWWRKSPSDTVSKKEGAN